MTALRLTSFPDSEYDTWLVEQIERRLRMQFLPMYADEAFAQRAATDAVARLAPGAGATQLSRVLDDDRPVGWVWLQPAEDPGGDLRLLDADCDASVAELLALLITEAADARHLLIDRMAGAATPTALAEAGSMTPTSSNMALQIDRSQASDRTTPCAGVRLVPMSQERFGSWRECAEVDYARDIDESTTLDADEAMAKSIDDFAVLLPDGFGTADQALFDVRDAADGVVGMLWLARRAPTAYFVYDVVIEAAARGRGLGRATMHAAAEWVREQGGDVLALNVFGRNHVARALYLSLGYRVVVEEMVHALQTPETRE